MYCTSGFHRNDFVVSTLYRGLQVLQQLLGFNTLNHFKQTSSMVWGNNTVAQHALKEQRHLISIGTTEIRHGVQRKVF